MQSVLSVSSLRPYIAYSQQPLKRVRMLSAY